MVNYQRNLVKQQQQYLAESDACSVDKCLGYCLNEVEPIVKGLIQLKDREVNAELLKNLNILEEEVEKSRVQLLEKDTQIKAKDTLLFQMVEINKQQLNTITNLSAQVEDKNLQIIICKRQEKDLAYLSPYVDRVDQMQIKNLTAFQVSYISPSPDWIVIQTRIDGSVDFDRDWIDYQNGFGDINGNFFIGLEKLHLLTQSRQYELYIQMRDVTGTTKYARYNNFNVAGEKDYYKIISVGQYTGTAGDSLTQHVGDMFSTRDQDNGNHTFNCAYKKRGGWWYHDCNHSKLNGLYHADGLSANTTGISWGSWSNWNYTISLTFAQMMIRPALT
ncbi:fibrinogen-like protein 1 [Drosophila tropicalis]|uniref:fibrinogen-like protein 1 n=1 Tax=Drosophila tropicalis TaxID=46794 RepID=UPI0035AB7693